MPKVQSSLGNYTPYKLNAKKGHIIEQDPSNNFLPKGEPFSAYMGCLTDIQFSEYQFEGRTNHKVVLLFNTPDGKNPEKIEMGVSNLCGGLLNGIAGGIKSKNMSLSEPIYFRLYKKEDSEYTSLYLEMEYDGSEGTKVGWLYSYEDFQAIMSDINRLKKFVDGEIRPYLAKIEDKSEPKPEGNRPGPEMPHEEVVGSGADDLPY